ncbi:MAG: hypothetical protein KKC71_03305 [Chloroflexi bacterium]|nr:hypothetical protein [Chloroflexota bacterium]
MNLKQVFMAIGSHMLVDFDHFQSQISGSLPVECSRRIMDLNREETKPAKAFFRFFLAFFPEGHRDGARLRGSFPTE